MIMIAGKDVVERVCLAVLLLFSLECGGRVIDDNGTADDGTKPPTDKPAPTCSEICRHVIDSCFPGGLIDGCARDCETMRADYLGCMGLDPFLRCNLTARVRCTDMAVIDDCYVERNELVRCKSK